MKQFLSFLIILFITGSCAEFQEPVFKGVEGNHIKKFEGKTIETDLAVRLYNPNNYAVKAKPSDVDVYIDEKQVGTIHLEKKVKLKAKQDTVVVLPLRIDLSNGAMFTLLKNASRENVAVTLKGKVKGGVFIFSKKVDINETRTISGKLLKIPGAQ